MFKTDQFRQSRFLRLVTQVEFTDTCWLWTGALMPNGYGSFQDKHVRAFSAHRAMFFYANGYLPQLPQTVDHECSVRNCVNPQHLRDVTARENVMRTNAPTAINARKTHCPQGHPYAGDNLQVYVLKAGPARYCRICGNAKSKRLKAAKRQLIRGMK